ncbi:uncharacterized protein LOC130998165 [Salvia miltiorrhiza]|uniref:uncharacterized protein LOC130998165 n=1 Tax=Salvia miltiorrhiza TaxID=226208 RepID=UPI0025AC4A83|nr:uncharacterized protein LOC130998165 [Salvia miltiorrhiza]
MAVQVFPDGPSSPRISFSHDLRNDDVVPVEHYPRSPSSGIDFDFCVFRESFDHESSSADELFFDGKILPIQIKKRLSPPLLRSAPPPPPPAVSEKLNQRPSSFWGFKRSASWNCGSGYARTLCPLPLLSRSNSTGSTASVKRSPKQNSSNYHKPPLKKGSYNGAVKINPILNVPSANLFGLGSIFSRDKGKKKGLFFI